MRNVERGIGNGKGGGAFLIIQGRAIFFAKDSIPLVMVCKNEISMYRL